MNNDNYEYEYEYEYEYGEIGTFCKLLKIEKTIVYAFNYVSLSRSIIKEGLRGFLS